MNLNTINDIIGDVRGKRVLVRADLNVPTEGTTITDDERIVRFAPTARLLADNGAKVIIITHFGRPKGKTPEFSSRILVDSLSVAVGKPVAFIDDTIGESVVAAIAKMNDGDILLTENVRFYPEEEANDSSFAKSLASLGDIYVNDAFSAAHRAHASTEGITKYLPSYAGLLMAEEVNALSAALENPARPSIAIVAGAKVSTKISVLENIAAKVDALVVGGAMANTFLYAKGLPVGASMFEADMKDTAIRIMAAAEVNGCKILLPVDVRVAVDLTAPARVVDARDVAENDKIFDIGDKAVAEFESEIAKSKTVLMNGPVGVFETAPFDIGTNAIVRFIADRTTAGELVSIAGGGDTISALHHAGVADKFTYVSTAGGAFLEWLEGKTLPAVVPLVKK